MCVAPTNGKHKIIFVWREGHISVLCNNCLVVIYTYLPTRWWAPWSLRCRLQSELFFSISSPSCSFAMLFLPVLQQDALAWCGHTWHHESNWMRCMRSSRHLLFSQGRGEIGAWLLCLPWDEASIYHRGSTLHWPPAVPHRRGAVVRCGGRAHSHRRPSARPHANLHPLEVGFPFVILQVILLGQLI